MTTRTLYYLSSKIEDSLKESVADNLGRYAGDGFEEYAQEEGWCIPLSLPVDLSVLGRLNPKGGADCEVANSLAVWAGLGKLTPALASEGRLWTRLCHVECFEYARNRWMNGLAGEKALKSARAHFFADTLTRRRDDNAIGRLWWNAYVAKLALPGRQHDALKALLRTADIRSNIVERARTIRMQQLAGGVLRFVLSDQKVTATEETFRAFMRNINRLGGGILFHLMEPAEVDRWLERCIPS